MKAKDKAKELVDKYNDEELFYLLTFRQAKQCALIAVDEIYNGGLHLRYGAYLDEFEDKQNYYSYWEEVKQEINKL